MPSIKDNQCHAAVVQVHGKRPGTREIGRLGSRARTSAIQA